MLKTNDQPNAGVYCIYCKANGRIYYGNTNSFSNRRRSHFGSLKAGKHVIEELQADWNLYGKDGFYFVPIQTFATRDERLIAEQALVASLMEKEPTKLYNRTKFEYKKNDTKHNYKRNNKVTIYLPDYQIRFIKSQVRPGYGFSNILQAAMDSLMKGETKK